MICECSDELQKFTHYDTCKTCGGDRSIEWDGFVRQRRQDDCVIASYAMALDRPYEEVRAMARRKKLYHEWKGTFMGGGLLEAFGLKACDYRGFDGDFKSLHFENTHYKNSYFLENLWGRKCLLSMPSLNSIGGYHSVYYDGCDVWDPQWDCKQRVTKFEDLQVRAAVIFRADQ